MEVVEKRDAAPQAQGLGRMLKNRLMMGMILMLGLSAMPLGEQRQSAKPEVKRALNENRRKTQPPVIPLSHQPDTINPQKELLARRNSSNNPGRELSKEHTEDLLSRLKFYTSKEWINLSPEEQKNAAAAQQKLAGHYMKKVGFIKKLNANQPMKRWEIIKMLMKARYPESVIQGSDCFPDISNQPFAKYVCFAKQLGVVKGHSGGRNKGEFTPSAFMNYAALYKVAGKALLSTEGGKTNPWYRGHLYNAKKNEFLLPEHDPDIPDAQLNPQLAKKVTQARLSVIIALACKTAQDCEGFQ